MHFLMISVICAIVAIIISIIWYAPFMFGKTWTKLTGVDRADKAGRGVMILYSGLANIALAVTLYSVALWSNAYGVQSTLVMGMLISFGIVMVSMMIPYMWEKKSPKLFMINAGHQIAVIMVMSAIIGYLQ